MLIFVTKYNKIIIILKSRVSFFFEISYQSFLQNIPVQRRVFKSIKLWSFYVDLEESIGTVESTRAVYDRILELKIATPQIIINYANFLEENKYFEESFKVIGFHYSKIKFLILNNPYAN